jgi:hypothetical protein
MKKVLFYSVTILLAISCQKDNSVQPMPTNESVIVQSESYFYKDTEYTFSYYKYGNDSIKFLQTEDNNILLEVFAKPNASLLYLSDKVMLFDDSNESQEYLNKITKTKVNKPMDFGIPVTPEIYVYCYEDIDFKGGLLRIDSYDENPSIGIYGIKNLSGRGWNDKISSIKGAIKFHQWIYFYEKKDYDGKSIGWSGFPSQETTISESNLHKRIMRDLLITKIYWGDNISSIKWNSLQ